MLNVVLNVVFSEERPVTALFDMRLTTQGVWPAPRSPPVQVSSPRAERGKHLARPRPIESSRKHVGHIDFVRTALAESGGAPCTTKRPT